MAQGEPEENRGQTPISTGTLFEGRFRSCLVGESRYLLACHAYIELNPVRAGMVAHPAAYRWSSYATNAQGQVAELLGRRTVRGTPGRKPRRPAEDVE